MPAPENFTEFVTVSSHRLLKAAWRDAVLRALAGLSRQQRAILVLRYLEDLSVTETAQLLGCSTSTVTTQTSRALAAMRAAPQLQQTSSNGVRS